MANIGVQNLRPGDILLHAGRGEISELIKWASDSPYSHTAMVYDVTRLAEAMSAGVRFNITLAARAIDTANFSRIDVIRPVNAINSSNMALLQASAQSLKDLPFALNQMVELGVICLLKNKITGDPRVRLLIWWLAGRLLPSTPNRLVCSEFVYRAYHGVATVPAGIVDPAILVGVGPRDEVQFPDIDWSELWQEYEEARKNGVDKGLAILPPQPDPELVVTEEMLQQALVLGMQSVTQSQMLAFESAALEFAKAVPAPIRIQDPNPATVLPQDLADSPTFQAFGRLL